MPPVALCRAYGPRSTLALAAAEAGEDILATLLIAVVKLDDGTASGTDGVLLDMPDGERSGMMEQAERTLALVRRLLSRAECCGSEGKGGVSGIPVELLFRALPLGAGS